MAVPRVRVHQRQPQRRRSLVSALNSMRCNLVSSVIYKLLQIILCLSSSYKNTFISLVVVYIIIIANNNNNNIVNVNNIVCIVNTFLYS